MTKHRFDREEDPESNPEPGAGRSIPTDGWRICFDAPPGESQALLAEPGDILGLFRAWHVVRRPLAARIADRRESSRYRPVETNIWIGWWQARGFVVIQARLVNLSQGGALVQVRKRPPLGQPVWLCLGTPHPIDHVQARVLDTLADPDQAEFGARLEFHLPCPARFFLSVGCEAML